MRLGREDDRKRALPVANIDACLAAKATALPCARGHGIGGPVSRTVKELSGLGEAG